MAFWGIPVPHFNEILPEAPKADIIPSEFRDYFEEIRRRSHKGE